MVLRNDQVSGSLHDPLSALTEQERDALSDADRYAWSRLRDPDWPRRFNIDIGRVKNRRQWITYVTKEDRDPLFRGISDSEFNCAYRVWKTSKRGYNAADPFIRRHVAYSRVARDIAAQRFQHRTRGPKVVVLTGETGTGKTRTSVALFKAEEYYIKEADNRWWDGYTQQKGIIIDDYCSNFSLDYLLRLLDMYPMTVEIKGGTIRIKSQYIFITIIGLPGLNLIQDIWEQQ